MARILVQTNDYRTVLDENHVEPADIDVESSAGDLLARLRSAVLDAERKPVPRARPVKRLASIVGVSDYLAVTE